MDTTRSTAARDPGGSSKVLDAPKWCSLGVGAAGVIAAVVPLLRSHPWQFETIVALMAAGVVLLCGVTVVGVIAVITHRPRLLVAPVIGLVAFGLAVRVAPEIHWRLSEDELIDVATGAITLDDCSYNDPCRVGWWDVEEVDVNEVLPTVWVAGSCYAGHGYARPAPGLSEAEVRAEAEARYGGRGFLEVSEWQDGWVLLCFTT